MARLFLLFFSADRGSVFQTLHLPNEQYFTRKPPVSLITRATALEDPYPQ
jgi:hypothetical protein